MSDLSQKKLRNISRRLLPAIAIPSVLTLLAVIGYVKFNGGASVDDLLILSVPVLGIVLIFASFLLKKFKRRIDIIRKALVELANGHSDHDLPVENNDEITEMAAAINKVSAGFRQKTEFITQIEAGNLNAVYTPLSDTDLLGHSLLKMKGALIRIKNEDEKRTWAAEGLAKFAGILQSAHDIKSLSDQVITNLVKVLQATQGAIFVLNEGDDAHLEMTACYAYNRLKYLTRRVEIGEGLVGQTFLEKQTVYLREVPDNYVTITSGLGQANPNFLLIVPLHMNQRVAGIIELASFKDFEPYKIEFVEKLGQNVAHTITNFRVNENTKRLLKESQQNTERMRLQEESLRQNQEELQATQEEISRKYDALFKQLIDLNYESKFDQLRSINSTKKRNIEYYFDIIRKQILTYAENSAVIDAMKKFKIAFNQLPDRLSPEDRSTLTGDVKRYYDSDFIPRLNENAALVASSDNYLPQDPRTLQLQRLYIAANPFPTGKKFMLSKIETDLTYNEVHSAYHPQLRSFLEKFGYYDIFLVDHETGNMVYSVFKEVDFATSLFDGIYSNTNFGRVVKAAAASENKGFVQLVDFEAYEPSYRAPASFIACPIYDHDTKAGILVFQMPINKINQVLTGDNKWEDDGLGKSGETVITGSDHTLRSVSRKLIQAPEIYFREMVSRGYSREQLNEIRKSNTSILLEKLHLGSIGKALQGETGTVLEKGDTGEDILTAYAPLDIQDVNWIILSVMTERETSQKIKDLRNK